MTAAKFAGICAACDGPIAPGDPIERDNDSPTWIHRNCPDVNAASDAHALQQPRCSRCGTNHPGEC